MEIWKTIKGFENYQVSNLGNVKSLEKYYLMRNKYPILLKERILKQVNSNGYLSVGVHLNNKQKTIKVHRLVAIAFIPNLFNKASVNHINGIKSDNRFENLEWCTSKENTKHAIKNNLIIFKKGEDSKCVKLNNIKVLEIRESNLTPTQLSKIYNISRTTIYDIKLNKTWTHI